jgi:hypothetical protein
MSRRRTAFRHLASVVSASLVGPLAMAQDVPGDLEQIIVTGSRIARPDFESASPIVSIDAEAFARSNATSVETIVSRLPQFLPSYGSTSNNPGNGGQGNLQLRGLGLTSTLVLLDGRRITPANGTGAADVNVIPAALVESVEVITGGASAVYGSDAIAGVVNFKLKDEFHGVQVDGGWGQTGHGDGTEYNFSVTGGLDFAGGRGEAYAHVGYANRDAVLQGDRRFSRVALGYNPLTGEFAPSGSPTIVEGRMPLPPPQRPSLAAWNALFADYGYAPGTVPLLSASGANGIGFNADGTLFAAGNRIPGSIANFRGEQDPALASDSFYSYNFAPDNYLQLPLERVTAFARAQFDLTECARAVRRSPLRGLLGRHAARAGARCPAMCATCEQSLHSCRSQAVAGFAGEPVDRLLHRQAGGRARTAHRRERQRDLLQGTLGLSRRPVCRLDLRDLPAGRVLRFDPDRETGTCCARKCTSSPTLRTAGSQPAAASTCSGPAPSAPNARATWRMPASTATASISSSPRRRRAAACTRCPPATCRSPPASSTSATSTSTKATRSPAVFLR